MKIKSAEFITSAPNLQGCPTLQFAEFAFIGRSNVGKSSLINLLCHRRDLAMVSGTPGKTKLINFFVINQAWTLVDLPGYGFAKVGQHQRADFNEAVADFLEHRENLACAFVLIDSKLPPQPIDLEFLRWLDDAGVPFALVFTKTDQQPSKVERNVATFLQALRDVGVTPPDALFRCSATTGTGRVELLSFIEQQISGRTRQHVPEQPDAPSSAPAQPAADEDDDYEDPNDWDKIS